MPFELLAQAWIGEPVGTLDEAAVLRDQVPDAFDDGEAGHVNPRSSR